MDDKSGKQTIEYGVVAVGVMASMSGLDFVRAIFARRLPEPPIMQIVEPFDCTIEPGVVVIHSVPGLRSGRAQQQVRSRATSLPRSGHPWSARRGPTARCCWRDR
jgi:hypothetical protein